VLQKEGGGFSYGLKEREGKCDKKPKEDVLFSRRKAVRYYRGERGKIPLE